MLWLGVPDPTRSKGGWWASENLKKRGPDPEEEEGEGGGGGEGGRERGKGRMKDLVVVCRKCWHLMHAGHAEEWFAGGNRECPVPGCGCACEEGDGGVVSGGLGGGGADGAVVV